MSKQWLSEERTRRLRELRAKYRKPELVGRSIHESDIVHWLSQEKNIGYMERDENYWHVSHGIVELRDGSLVEVWMVEETWLPLRTEILEECPPLITPNQEWIDNPPPLA